MRPSMLNKPHHTRAYLLPRFVILVIGTLITLTLFQLTRNQEQKQALALLQSEADIVANRLADRLNDRSLALTAIGSLTDINKQFSQQQFHQWAIPFLNYYPDIHRIEWAPALTYEELMALPDAPDIQMVVDNSNVEDVTANTEVLPILHVVPEAGQSSKLNLNSVPYWRDALTQAREQKQIVALANAHPVQANEDKEVQLFQPVFAEDQRFLGFIGLSLSLSRFIEGGGALSRLPGVGYRFYDLDQQTKAPLYETGADDAFDSHKLPLFQAKYPVADRTWLVQVHPSHRFVNSQRTVTPVLLAFMGLTITLLVYIGYHLNVLRRRQLQKQLEEHQRKLDINEKALANKAVEKGVLSRALHDSERRARDIISLVRDYTWEIDPDGRFTFLSPQAADIKGFAPQDLLDQSIFSLLANESDGEHLRQLLTQCRKHPKAVDAELAFKDENGNIHHEHIRLLAHIDSLGACLGYRGIGYRLSKDH